MPKAAPREARVRRVIVAPAIGDIFKVSPALRKKQGWRDITEIEIYRLPTKTRYSAGYRVIPTYMDYVPDHQRRDFKYLEPSRLKSLGAPIGHNHIVVDPKITKKEKEFQKLISRMEEIFHS